MKILLILLVALMATSCAAKKPVLMAHCDKVNNDLDHNECWGL